MPDLLPEQGPYPRTARVASRSARVFRLRSDSRRNQRTRLSHDGISTSAPSRALTTPRRHRRRSARSPHVSTADLPRAQRVASHSRPRKAVRIRLYLYELPVSLRGWPFPYNAAAVWAALSLAKSSCMLKLRHSLSYMCLACFCPPYSLLHV